MRPSNLRLGILAIAGLFSATAIAAAEPRTDCPTPTPCKVIVLTADEEKVLTGANGILDTAAAGRTLDLGNLVAYFRSKISTAPAGDQPKPETANSAPPPGKN